VVGPAAGRVGLMASRGPDGWNARYADATRPWPSEPSSTVTAALADLPAGTALDAAAGTGRHARWLARRGWRVTAVDFSAVGVERGRQEGADLPITWVVADVTAWEPAQSFHLVLLAHVQLGADGVRRVATWLRPGGRLVVVGHALRNLTDGVHGPRSPDLLHTPEQLRAGADGLAVERLEEVERDDEGGTVVELVLVARRPADDQAGDRHG
jgi:SAM-dependent methyltransferase